MYQGPQNEVVVYRHDAGRDAGTYDFRIVAVENGNTLASSHQGYVDYEEARRIGLRCVTAPYVLTFNGQETS